MNNYDVIIIGGGPSGSTAASFISMSGLSVLILEKEKFPREHIGESLIPASYSVLKNLGVLEGLKKISPRKPGVNFIAGDGQEQSLWCFKNVVKDESYLSFHVKRSAFDQMLLDNSRKKGAHVLEEHTVKHVMLDREDGMVMVKAESRSGEVKEFIAKFLIDASGQSTFLGTRMGVKKSFAGLDRVALWSHWTGAEYDVALKEGAIKIVYLNGNEKLGWFWIIPLSKDNLSVGVVVNNSYIKQEKAKLADSPDWKLDIFMKEINDSPHVRQLLSKGKLDHKVQINSDYSYYCEKKYGNNYALIGDAGAFLDPVFSSGIFVGMHSAELVADAVIQKLKKNDSVKMDQVYERINGAIKVIEKFIRLFYSPENINFSELGDPRRQLEYKDTEGMYAIFHYLLAGDFFNHYEKYSHFLDTIKDPKKLASFKNLISHTTLYDKGASCGENFDEMYGEMTYDVEFDPEFFS